MKKFFAITIAIVMIMAMTTTAFAAEDTTTVYFDIGDTDFGTVYCYAWESGNMNNKNGVWPGVEMTHVTGSIYSIELSSSWDTVIFNNGSTQTQDITLPTDGKNLYLYESNTWSTYGAATNKYDDKDAGDYAIGVSGAYKPGANAADVVSVDVAWDAMNFTYNEGTLGTWSPENHSYSGGTEGSWSTDKAGITVTNHSNTWIEASMSFAAVEGVTTAGSFYASANATTALTPDKQYVDLANAENTSGANVPKGTLYFGVSGDPITKDTSLGTITVKIAKDPKIYTGEALAAALTALGTDGGTITLGGDVTLTDPIEIPAGTGTPTSPLIIDFGGKTVNGRIAIAAPDTQSTSRSYVTLKNGNLNYSVDATDTTLRDDPAQAAVYAKYTDLKLENLDISSHQLALLTSTGTKTLIEGENVVSITGEYCWNGYENIAIYNASSEGFTLSATNGGEMKINYYIVSEYAITLKAGGDYIFQKDGLEFVFFYELGSDTEIGHWEAYPGSSGNGPEDIYIVLY